MKTIKKIINAAHKVIGVKNYNDVIFKTSVCYLAKMEGYGYKDLKEYMNISKYEFYKYYHKALYDNGDTTRIISMIRNKLYNEDVREYKNTRVELFKFTDKEIKQIKNAIEESMRFMENYGRVQIM